MKSKTHRQATRTEPDPTPIGNASQPDALAGAAVTVHADGRFDFVGARARLHARMVPPRIAGAAPAPLVFGPGRATETELAGIAGTLETAESPAPGVGVTREWFRARDGRMAAVRMTVTNTGAQPFALDALVPLRAQGADGLRIGDAGFAQWCVLRMDRHKNGIPGAFRPAVDDADREHALVDASEFRAGMGDTEPSTPGAAPRTVVHSEPCVHVWEAAAPAAPGLFVGVLGQTEHLTRIRLAGDADGGALDTFDVYCEFDGVPVAPGEQRRTHWVLLWEQADPAAAMAAYAELLAAEWHIAPPPPAPSIFCSWYFYGRDFTEADLRENLEALAARPIPFDVLLLDNGWMDTFGTWAAHERFPSGIAAVASAIRQAGYTPGIWTAPFTLMRRSPILERYPDLVARKADGAPCTYPYHEPDLKEDLYVLDPTAPNAPAYLEEFYGRLRAWGFRAHKLDFLRAIVVADGIRFHDRRLNRAQAYRRGLELIRRAVGPDGYILACGGLMEGSLGLVDGNRVGRDVKGRWYETDGKPCHLIRIKQNVFRAYTNRWWHTDPDALQIRRRTGPFRGQEAFAHLSDGSFTDDEAFTCVVNQYLGGGLVCLSERVAELAEDRRRLYRHCLPPAAPAARPLDPGYPFCPTRFLTRVTPRAAELGAWWTLAAGNWDDAPAERDVTLEGLPAEAHGRPLAVFEFATQRFLGLHRAGETLRLAIPAHGMRVLRLAPWDGRSPLLLGTDMHLTGGGAEFERLAVTPTRLEGRLATPWRLPITATVGLPVGGGALRVVRCVIAPEPRAFSIAYDY